MRNASLLLGSVALFSAGAVHAQSSSSTFENVAGGPGSGSYTTVATADGWTGTANGIELQNHAAGNPALAGGNVFVELDTSANSAMSRLLNAGTYSLDFLYSARPGVAAGSNGIEVLLNGNSLLSVTASGGSATSWSTFFVTPFFASAGSTLTFQAIGTSDSYGGYVDNINISAVPEAATWAMMLTGFGVIGFAARRRQSVKTTVSFA